MARMVAMRRRDYLVATGAVATTIMGGVGQIPNVSAQNGQFELVEVEAPSEVGVMEPFTYSYTVANRGNEDATFWTYFTVDAWGENQVRSERHALEMPAGEEKIVKNNTAHSPYIGTLRYQIQAFEESFSIEAVPASREFGEAWRSPNDIRIAVDNLELTDSYEYEDYDGSTAEESAPSSSQWAFIDVQVVNVGDESEFTPFNSDINLIANEQQFEATYISREVGAYEGSEIRPKISREGWITYEVPAELAPDDIEVSYTGSGVEGEWTVRWLTSSGDENESNSE